MPSIVVPLDALPAVVEVLEAAHMPYTALAWEADGMVIGILAQLGDELKQRLERAGAMVQA